MCGIEISPYITCVTPANDFGYNDFYHYHGKKGSFSHRYHTPYIYRKVNEFCEKFFTKYENEKYNNIIKEVIWKMDFIWLIVGIIITVIAAIIEFFNNSGGNGLLM